MEKEKQTVASAKKPDIRTDLMTEEEFERNCLHYSDFAFFTPPERFLFHHYDEDPEELLIAHRPMPMIEKYVVNDMAGGFYGTYDTRDVSKHLKMGTWVQVPDEGFFIKADISRLERELEEKRASLLNEQKTRSCSE